MSEEREREEAEEEMTDAERRLDRFTVRRGDLHQISRGEGPTLAELERQHQEQQKKKPE